MHLCFRNWFRLGLTMLSGFLSLWLSTGLSTAMTFRSEVVVNQPFGALTASIHAEGEIIPGDAAAILMAIRAVDAPEISAIFVTFDSPGGSLYEGMAMGQALADYPKSVIGRIEGSCASACTFAFIGAEYRDVAQNGRFGIHQFRFSDDPARSVSDGQIVSADVARFLTDQGVDIEFLRRMASMPAEGIDWVSKEDLKRWGIVNGIVKQESVEIDIVVGLPVLALNQTNVFGEYNLMLSCRDGVLSGVATLQDPERPVIGSLALGLDGRDHVVPDRQWKIEQRVGGKTSFSFKLPGSVGDLASRSRWIGIFVYDPPQANWYGFEVEVTDNSQYAVLQNCSGSNN